MPTTAYYAIALSTLQAVSLAVAFLAWRRRSTTGSIYLALMMLAVAVWSAAAAIEVVSTDQSTKILWLQISFIGVCAAPPLFLLFALKYWRPEIRVSLLYRICIWVVPVATILIAATNDLHHLLWDNFTFESPDTNILIYGYGIWFWINVAYSYAVMFSSVVLLSRVAIGFPRLYRHQALIVLIAAILPWIGYAIYVFGGFPVSVLAAPIAFSVTGVIFAMGLLKLQLFDIVPVARENVIQHMDVGMLVLDYKARIVDFNSAAGRVIGKNLGVGQKIGEVLDNWRDMPSLSAGINERKEIFLEQRNPPLWLDVSVSSLRDRSDRLSGYLIMLQDITERKRAQEALQESEQKHRSLYVDSRDAVMMVSLDEGFLAGNPATIEIFGCRDEQDFIARTPASLSPEYQPDGARSLDKSQEMMRLAMEKGSYSFEWMHRRADGADFLATVLLSRLEIGGNRLLQATVRDITESKRAQEALRTSEARYRSYLEVTGQIGWITPADGVVDDIPEWRKYTGQSIADVKGWGWLAAIHPDDREYTTEVWNRAVAAKSLYETEYRIRRHDGVYRYFLARGIPSLREDGTIREWVGTCIDITERKQAEDALIEAHNAFQHQATHDPLTGVLNRRAILDVLSRELARARRQHIGLAIGICDIDHFKKINDTYGHPVGDEVLCGLVRIMNSHLRQYDTLGRFGGEEFLIVTPGVKGNDAIAVYQRLLSGVAENSLATKSGNVSITVSIGVKILTGEEHVEELLKAADDALYDAKNGGRNRVFLMHDKQI
jgi:diguanylate cyclase (GGDEF)-like protein/PAS domain S-box-containing protein